MVIAQLRIVLDQCILVKEVLRALHIVLSLLFDEVRVDVWVDSVLQVVLFRDVYLQCSNGIFNELHRVVVILQSIEVGAFGARLEPSLPKFVP